MFRTENDQRAERNGEVGPPAARPAGFDLSAVPTAWRAAGIVLSQTALLTALLFYFGWARSRETYGYFGVDVELLGFSASDYLLRSVNSAFRPLIVLGLAAVVFTVVHGRVSGGHRKKNLAPILLAIGGLAVAVGIAGIAVSDFGRELGVGLPVSVAAGFSLIAYADLEWWRVRGGSSRRRTPDAQLRTFFLLGLAVLGVFWAVSLYALEVGRERAETLHRDLRSRTQVVVYSEQRLSLAGPGVQRIEQPPGSRYRHRYSGLRLLAETDDHYFLLPAGWEKGRDSAMVIPGSDDIRLDFHAAAAR
jgi:hypothetical protein